MLQLILKIILIVLLTILFVQDIRSRKVSLYILIASFIVTVTLVFLVDRINLFDFGLNTLFILLQLIFLMFYLFVTGRKPSSLLKNYLGIGDILFWVIPAVYFQFLEFILFSLFCYIAIVIGYGILYAIKRKSITIPLAGFMALFLAIYFIVSWENNCMISSYVLSFINI
ncbi:MAG: hypothetical protein AB9846_17915 [Tenuifilaceae bacterium]